MIKNIRAPHIAAGLYNSDAVFIYTSVTFAISTLSLISKENFYEFSKLLIKSISSKNPS